MCSKSSAEYEVLTGCWRQMFFGRTTNADTLVQNQDFLFKKMCKKLLENISFPTCIFFSKMGKKLFIFLSFFRPKTGINLKFNYWGMHFLHIFYS